MWWNGTATMHIRVDERSQRHRALQTHIQRKAQFPHQGEVWSEASGRDDLIDWAQTFFFSRDDDPLTNLVERPDVDIGDQAYLPALHECLDAPAEFAACGQRVLLTATKQLAHVGAADGPEQAGRRRRLGPRHARPQRAECLVAACHPPHARTALSPTA